MRIQIHKTCWQLNLLHLQLIVRRGEMTVVELHIGRIEDLGAARILADHVPSPHRQLVIFPQLVVVRGHVFPEETAGH